LLRKVARGPHQRDQHYAGETADYEYE